MKRLDLYRLKQALDSLGKIESINFAYVVVKNLKLIEKEIEILEEVRKPSDDYMNVFQPKVDELVREHAEKDKDGKPKSTNVGGQPSIQVDPKQKEAFDKKLTVLEKEHQDIVDKRIEQIKTFTDLLQEEIEIDLVKTKKKDLPETLTVSDIYNISDILEDI